MSIRVAVVDDEVSMRITLRALLSALPDVTEVDTYANASEALRGIARDQPQVVFLDFVMPGMTGLACLREWRARWPELKIIMNTGVSDPDAVLATMKAHGNGYLLKPVTFTEYQTALQTVMVGRFYMSPAMARLVKDYQPMYEPEEILPEFLSDVLFLVWNKNKSLAGYWVKLAEEAHYQVKALARLLGISVRHLLRVWRKSFNACCWRWLCRRRLALGIQQLLKVRSVKEAADKAGYKQTANFHRRFNDCYHITPRHYARSQ